MRQIVEEVLLVTVCRENASWMVICSAQPEVVRMRTSISFILLIAVASAYAAELPLAINRKHDVPVVDVKVNGKVARFILDTGSANTLVADDLTSRKAPGRSEFRRDQNGLEVNGTWWEVDFEIAGRRWPRRTVGVIDLSRVREHYGKDISGLLGVDVLMEFDSVRIDYRRRRLTLE